MIPADTHSFTPFIHIFSTAKKAAEQEFHRLSTKNRAGYYYYLYIEKTSPQTNYTGLKKLQVSKRLGAVPDFQLKRTRVTA